MTQVSVASRSQAGTQPATPILEAIDLSKHYGGIQALTGANVHIMPGEVVGIMGDNGAG